MKEEDIVENWSARYYYSMYDTMDFVYPVNVFLLDRIKKNYINARYREQLSNFISIYHCNETAEFLERDLGS